MTLQYFIASAVYGGSLLDNADWNACAASGGHKCNGVGHWRPPFNATGLYLYNEGLTGPIPGASLAQMTGLQYLFLAGGGSKGSPNRLTGPIPKEIGLLTNLIGLWLEGNAFTGAEGIGLCELIENGWVSGGCQLQANPFDPALCPACINKYRFRGCHNPQAPPAHCLANIGYPCADGDASCSWSKHEIADGSICRELVVLNEETPCFQDYWAASATLFKDYQPGPCPSNFTQFGRTQVAVCAGSFPDTATAYTRDYNPTFPTPSPTALRLPSDE